MARSNSKLDQYENEARKDWKIWFKEQNGTIHSFPQLGVTIGIMAYGSRNAMLYTSVASTDEKKFRRKVGEYHMLNRWDLGQGVVIPRPVDVAAFAEEVATVLASHAFPDSFAQGYDEWPFGDYS